MPIRSFTELNAWKEGHKLVLSIYKVTKTFPTDERFGLIDQLRRAAISVTSGIAEGFSRNTARDKGQFFYIALGSLTEIQNQLLAARDLGYIDTLKFREVADLTVTVHKLINGLQKSAMTKIHNT
ncbi:MAG: four helix bundle protein [Patescibacteria group bacterium]